MSAPDTAAGGDRRHADGSDGAPRRPPTRDDGVVEIDERRDKMERLRAEGVDPYPPVTLWDTRTLICDMLAAHDPASSRPASTPIMPTRSPAG